MMNDIKELCKKLSVKASFVLSNKDKLELGYKTDIGAFTYINAENKDSPIS